MEIKFLGTGGAFDYKKNSSSATVHTAEGLFLIDCGPHIFSRLCELNLIDKIDYYLPTHLHGDHTGSLFQLEAYLRAHHGRKLTIVYPNDAILAVIKSFLALMYQFDNAVNYIPLSNFHTVGYIDTTGQHVPEMPSVGYYFTTDNELLYYSGDLGNIQTTLDFLKTRTESNVTVFHDINPKDGPSHVYYKQVPEVLKNYDVYGYHCDKDTLPNDNQVKLVEDYPKYLY